MQSNELFSAQDWQNPTADTLRLAYMHGAFPMHDSDDDVIGWYTPNPRGVIPLDGFHIPKNLARAVRRNDLEIRADTAFVDVMLACAEQTPDRDGRWINNCLLAAYADLFASGTAHSIEAWRGETLVGGLYGVHLGAVFFGESMFSRPGAGGTNASKICLVHLVRWMRERGFVLLDTQFWNPHLDQFGCIEIPRRKYLDQLQRALALDVTWGSFTPVRTTPERS
jgi:leucyl/phenylalanyl-tRNA--protein transferase